jgi:glyoxylase-like metal-dependent hydrolase (beta-lactamase superfamily II)
MRIATATLASLLTVACAFSLHAQTAAPAQPAPRDPFILADTTQQISPNVYVIPDKDSTPGVPNVGIIVGTRAALVIDPGLGFPNGAIVLAETLKLAPGRDLYIATTHVHPEHDLGANAFPPSAKMIRSSAQIKDIDEFGLQTAKAFSSHSAVQAEMLQGATFRKADIVFDKDYSLDLGGVQVHLAAMGANHTAGDTIMLVNPGRILFAGDLAMSGQPAFASPHSSLAHWLTTLDALDALQPTILVPSHGPIGNASFIAGYRTYLTTIRDRAAALKKQGLTVEQVTATLTPQMAAAYPNTQRLAGAIQAAYKEAP